MEFVIFISCIIFRIMVSHISSMQFKKLREGVPLFSIYRCNTVNLTFGVTRRYFSEPLRGPIVYIIQTERQLFNQVRIYIQCIVIKQLQPEVYVKMFWVCYLIGSQRLCNNYCTTVKVSNMCGIENNFLAISLGSSVYSLVRKKYSGFKRLYLF